ncbi:S8 family serine peptidase [Actinokineospora soli]|uniref:S8 family serine peptidase n=1 Tax=Actinokineospora soli TaxID=1048753 RepID=A0ABW2TKI6_9PSEU
MRRGATGFAAWSGTSFAAPQVTGAVAALMSRNGGMTAQEALELLPGHPDWPVFGYIHGA